MTAPERTLNAKQRDLVRLHELSPTFDLEAALKEYESKPRGRPAKPKSTGQPTVPDTEDAIRREGRFLLEHLENRNVPFVRKTCLWCNQDFCAPTNVAHTARMTAGRLATMRNTGSFGVRMSRKLTGGSFGKSRPRRSSRKLYVASKHSPERFLESNPQKKIWLYPRQPLPIGLLQILSKHPHLLQYAKNESSWAQWQQLSQWRQTRGLMQILPSHRYQP